MKLILLYALILPMFIEVSLLAAQLDFKAQSISQDLAKAQDFFEAQHQGRQELVEFGMQIA